MSTETTKSVTVLTAEWRRPLVPPILASKSDRVHRLIDLLGDNKLLLSLEKWNTVNFEGQLELDHYEKLRTYVDPVRQKEDLDCIREAAVSLRKAILENFLLQDILISINEDDTSYWGNM